MSLCNSILEQWYTTEIVIMVEDIYRVGGEEISETMEVEKMVATTEVTCNQEGRWSVKIIWLSVILFRQE